jgi:3-oxoacyl-[acyl-carrier-protein] synthase III
MDCNLEATTEKTMAAFQTNQATMPQDIVTKVGVAAGHIARIQQDYLVQAEAETSTDVRETLASRARDAAERVIDEQGISVQDYNTVLSAAQTDEDLERRLLDAAQEVL